VDLFLIDTNMTYAISIIVFLVKALALGHKFQRT